MVGVSSLRRLIGFRQRQDRGSYLPAAGVFAIHGQHCDGSAAGAPAGGVAAAGLGALPAAQADDWLLFWTRPPATSRAARAPAIAGRAILDHPRVGADRVAVQVLRAGIAVVLPVLSAASWTLMIASW